MAPSATGCQAGRRGGGYCAAGAGQQGQPQLASLHWHAAGGQLQVQVAQQLVLFTSLFVLFIVVFLQ